MEIAKIYGIYHADGGIIGELSYVWGKIRGTAHCSLCDITHKGISMKRDWKDFTNGLDVDFELLHLNEQSQGLADFTAGKTPCVLERWVKGMKSTRKVEGCNDGLARSRVPGSSLGLTNKLQTMVVRNT